MVNFSDFIQDENFKQDNKSENYDNKNTAQVSNEKLEDLINRYSTYSNDKLLSEFMRLTLEKKKRGELTENELSNIKNTILPFLNEEQKSNLENLIKMVKNV